MNFTDIARASRMEPRTEALWLTALLSCSLTVYTAYLCVYYRKMGYTWKMGLGKDPVKLDLSDSYREYWVAYYTRIQS